METLRIGPGVPAPPRARHDWLVEAAVIIGRGLLVGLGLGLGLTLWVAVGSLF